MHQPTAMTVKEAMPETTRAKVKAVIATKSRRKGMPVKIEVTKSLMDNTPEGIKWKVDGNLLERMSEICVVSDRIV